MKLLIGQKPSWDQELNLTDGGVLHSLSWYLSYVIEVLLVLIKLSRIYFYGESVPDMEGILGKKEKEKERQKKNGQIFRKSLEWGE